MKILRVDAKERSDHSLEAFIEPEIGRTYGIMVSEDDFYPAGKIECKVKNVSPLRQNLYLPAGAKVEG